MPATLSAARGGPWVVQDRTDCPRPVWLAQQAASGARKIVASPCKKWACEHCGRGKRAEALKLIRRVAEVGLAERPKDPLRFITLTRPRDKPNHLEDKTDVANASEDVRELVKAWRRGGRTMQYVRVLERTKRGRIHVHLLTWGDYVAKCTDRGRHARGLPTGKGSGSPCYCKPHRPCIQRLAWAHGWGWVDVRAIRSPNQAAAYLAKYLTKASDRDWPRHARRLSYSRSASDGLTLGAIHAGWVADVRRRMGAGPEEGPAPVWFGMVPRPSRGRFHPPGRDPPPWVNPTTGEILPIPF